MGAVPSREAPTAIYSLRYGSHELGLIPMTRANLCGDGEESAALRQQFVRLRNDPAVRYNQLRPENVPLTVLPGGSYTEEKLLAYVDQVEASLYSNNEGLLRAFEREISAVDEPFSSATSSFSSHTSSGATPKHQEGEKENVPPPPRGYYNKEEDELRLRRIKRAVRPVPCVVVFVYVKGHDDVECFQFRGRRVNVIGFLTCWAHESELDDLQKPYFELHKAMLKAAGDRTIERVVTLAATLYYEQLSNILMTHRPLLPFPQSIHERLCHLSLHVRCLWNNYPVLKLLFDSVSLLYATPELNVMECPPQIERVPADQSNYGEMVHIQLNGPLLCRVWTFMAKHLLRPASRGPMWVQFTLVNESLKNKRLVDWFTSSPWAQSFFSGSEMTQKVRDHLQDLHREIVNARSADPEDTVLWCSDQEWSYDRKLYRIYNSPVCGSFLTTVKQKYPREGMPTSVVIPSADVPAPTSRCDSSENTSFEHVSALGTHPTQPGTPSRKPKSSSTPSNPSATHSEAGAQRSGPPSTGPKQRSPKYTPNPDAHPLAKHARAQQTLPAHSQPHFAPPPPPPSPSVVSGSAPPSSVPFAWYQPSLHPTFAPENTSSAARCFAGPPPHVHGNAPVIAQRTACYGGGSLQPQTVLYDAGSVPASCPSHHSVSQASAAYVLSTPDGAYLTANGNVNAPHIASTNTVHTPVQFNGNLANTTTTTTNNNNNNNKSNSGIVPAVYQGGQQPLFVLISQPPPRSTSVSPSPSLQQQQQQQQQPTLPPHVPFHSAPFHFPLGSGATSSVENRCESFGLSSSSAPCNMVVPFSNEPATYLALNHSSSSSSSSPPQRIPSSGSAGAEVKGGIPSNHYSGRDGFVCSNGVPVPPSISTQKTFETNHTTRSAHSVWYKMQQPTPSMASSSSSLPFQSSGGNGVNPGVSRGIGADVPSEQIAVDGGGASPRLPQGSNYVYVLPYYPTR